MDRFERYGSMREKSRPERTLFDTYRGRDHPASSSFRVPHREPYYPMWEQNFYDRPPVNRYLTIGPSRSKRDSKNVMYLRPLSPDLDYYYRTRMLNRPIYEAKVESGRKRREKDRSATTSKAVKKKIERKYSSSSASTPVPVKLKIRKPKKTTRPVETTDHASSLSDSTSPPPPSTPPRPRKKRTVKKKPIETKASTTETFLSALDANRLQTVGKEEVSRIAEDFGQEPVSGQRNKQWKTSEIILFILGLASLIIGLAALAFFFSYKGQSSELPPCDNEQRELGLCRGQAWMQDGSIGVFGIILLLITVICVLLGFILLMAFCWQHFELRSHSPHWGSRSDYPEL